MEHPPLSWQRLGDPPPRTLVDARLQLHWAAQIVAAVGYTFIRPEPDYSHLSLTWLDDPGLLASRLTEGRHRFRAALRPADLTLLLLDAEDRALSTFNLHARLLDEGYAWLASAVGTFTGTTTALIRPDHTLPPHPVAEEGLFSLAPPAAFAEMARWYANAGHALQPLVSATANASPLRCWPHHFDIATLIQFDAAGEAEEARSIGVGMSPGDDSFAEPYWYVLPWPPPRRIDFPLLEGEGYWHTDNWVGAVLPASTLIEAETAEAQARRAQHFIRSAVSAGRALLGLGRSQGKAY